MVSLNVNGMNNLEKRGEIVNGIKKGGNASHISTRNSPYITRTQKKAIHSVAHLNCVIV